MSEQCGFCGRAVPEPGPCGEACARKLHLRATDRGIADQPPPVAATGPAIWDLVIADVEQLASCQDALSAAPYPLVIADMRERDRIGAERYGVRLQARNGRDPVVDCYQEALDAAVYMRQAVEEDPDDHAVRGMYRILVSNVITIRSLVGSRS